MAALHGDVPPIEAVVQGIARRANRGSRDHIVDHRHDAVVGMVVVDQRMIN